MQLIWYYGSDFVNKCGLLLLHCSGYPFNLTADLGRLTRTSQCKDAQVFLDKNCDNLFPVLKFLVWHYRIKILITPCCSLIHVNTVWSAKAFYGRSCCHSLISLLPPAYVICAKVMFSDMFVCQSVQLYPGGGGSQQYISSCIKPHPSVGVWRANR